MGETASRSQYPTDQRRGEVTLELVTLLTNLSERDITALDRWLASPDGKTEVADLLRCIAGLEDEVRSKLVQRLRTNQPLQIIRS